MFALSPFLRLKKAFGERSEKSIDKKLGGRRR
jgi:hypothetical protein